ncbi:MAG TPA: IS110 family transposase [Gemmataceae bacterium]|nr:IS110 family transposase [Gemmataceae bacterium]
MDPLLPVVLPCCCGIDVHKKSLTACLLTAGASGEVVQEVQTFTTLTAGLHALLAWLQQRGCRHVAVESTGVYWKPVFNVLQPAGLEVVLVNAAHVKNVPGRKTDVKDAEWLATLLRVGLLRGSLVPQPEQRDLRDLTRYRTQVIRQRAQECNRIQKLLEDANIKLASVASNILGASGRDMLRALSEGNDSPGLLANMARGRLRDKLPELRAALDGVLRPTQRWLLGEQLRKVTELDEAISRLDAQSAQLCLPFVQSLALLDQIPGINERLAQVIVAEIGLDMSRFAEPARLAAWAGVCPGNHETAGKRQSGKTRKGNRWLRPALVQASWAAARAKGTSLQATFGRLKGRRGVKRASLAVAHRLLRIVHRVLRTGQPYQEEGPEYYRAPDQERLKEKLLARLRRLGVRVSVTSEEGAA